MAALTGLRTLLLFDFKAATQLAPLAALRDLRSLTVAGFDGLNHARGLDLDCLAPQLQARPRPAPARGPVRRRAAPTRGPARAQSLALRVTIDAAHLAPLTCLTRLSWLTHLTLPGTLVASDNAREAELVQLVGALAGSLPGARARVHVRPRMNARATAHRRRAPGLRELHSRSFFPMSGAAGAHACASLTSLTRAPAPAVLGSARLPMGTAAAPSAAPAPRAVCSPVGAALAPLPDAWRRSLQHLNLHLGAPFPPAVTARAALRALHVSSSGPVGAAEYLPGIAALRARPARALRMPFNARHRARSPPRARAAHLQDLTLGLPDEPGLGARLGALAAATGLTRLRVLADVDVDAAGLLPLCAACRRLRELQLQGCAARVPRKAPGPPGARSRRGRSTGAARRGRAGACGWGIRPRRRWPRCPR